MELHVLKAMGGLMPVAISALLLSSCYERIAIDTASSGSRPIIYGRITTDNRRQEIRISRSAGYFSTTGAEGVSGAAVFLSDGISEYAMEEDAAEAGLYMTAVSLAGSVGGTYSLSVAMDFDGDGRNEEYMAQSVLPPSPQLDSIAIRGSALSGHHLEVAIWGRLPEGDNNSFNIRLYRNGVLVNDSLSGFRINDDSYMGRKTIAEAPVFYLDQEKESARIVEGDTVRLRIEGITKEYASFIRNAQAEHRGSIPLFSAPPANVETNIYSLSQEAAGPLGFFTASSACEIEVIYGKGSPINR
ncbi:MAG: DUF4249 domain-containing protein [Tannerellaceae bacterium]|jgi:hypothetical protein|nr:DUF4249 domain-containing protein [Tannerellaceae bacterium]